MKPWNASKIHYIKLGRNHAWWEECLNNNTIRLGFNTGDPEVLEMANSGDWDSLKKVYWPSRTKTPTQHTNQMRKFFEDTGKTLWITFEDGCLFYGFSNGGQVFPFKGVGQEKFGSSSYRKMAREGWSNLDAKGKTLRLEELSGRLTKTAAFRQTICDFGKEVENYLRNRIGGKVSPEVEQTETSKKGLEEAIGVLIRSFTYWDFELLVELIFSQSGFRRTTTTGGNQRLTDLDLINPVTGDKAFVQVKSATNQSQFEEYLNRRRRERDNFRMYYVFHTGSVYRGGISDAEIVIWGVEDVAKQVVANGLVDWVIERAK